MDLQCILCIANSSYAVKTPKDKVTWDTYWNLKKKLKIWTYFPQNGRFWDQTVGRETTSQNGSLLFKTGGLEHMVAITYIWTKISGKRYEWTVHWPSSRSNHRRCFFKNGVLRNFAKFTVKHLCQSLFLNKVASWVSFLIKLQASAWFWHRCFPVNFAKFLRFLIF